MIAKKNGANDLQEAAEKLLIALAEKTSETPLVAIGGPELEEITGLRSDEINAAITVLRDSGYVSWVLFLETVEYVFSEAWITSKGRYEAERLERLRSSVLVQRYENASLCDFVSTSRNATVQLDLDPRRVGAISLQPAPAGSPYGFTDRDWEYIARRKAKSDTLFVVMAFQFVSEHYETKSLFDNVRKMFESAVADYATRPGAWPTELDFRTLGAGYGEHLFNQIARDIISADIAVLETSDLNPNVMIELGVALTWGVRVLPVRESMQPVPPSDISGQTWAAYVDSAARFIDPSHHEKLVLMIERAMVTKAHH